jgi:hypothetical protein
MKTILVPTGGSDTDDTVFSTALTAARPFTAHLNFSHIKIDPGEATPYVSHVTAPLAAAAAKCNADLTVMGAYGRARTREVLFGGCTQSFIEHADRAVLMMH